MKKQVMVGWSLLLVAGLIVVQQSAAAAQDVRSPDALQAEIEAMKPADHVWRAIAWKTCPLDVLKTAREQQKPVIAWVFLGTPTDERC